MNGTETRMHESEAKLHNADAIAATKVTDVEDELKETVKKSQMIAEMLHTKRKSRLNGDENRTYYEDSERRKDRNKKLIKAIGRVENHMQTIEEEMYKKMRRKKSRATRVFRYFSTA